MTKHNTQVSFRLPVGIYDELLAIKERDGIPFSEQLRRGMRLWIDLRTAADTPQKKKAGRK